MLLVTCVAYHDADVVFLCECDAIGDIGWLGDVDGVGIVVPQCARAGSRGEGVAAFVREVGGHD